MGSLPAISGQQLIKLLVGDGWVEVRKARHGVALIKRYGDTTRVTIVPNKRASLPEGTPLAILGPKQTELGRKGFETLIKKYGLK